jgi:uncharacterized damage-inducible protein DinB
LSKLFFLIIKRPILQKNFIPMVFTSNLLAGEYPEYANIYLQHLYKEDVLAILQERVEATKQIYSQIAEEKGDFRYAPNKWSIKEVLLHIIDCERILSYRALAFARGERNALPGFDQDVYVQYSKAHERTMSSLISEFVAVRMSTLALFESMPTDYVHLIGNANGNPVSPRALAAMLAGHELHHTKIILDRYLSH